MAFNIRNRFTSAAGASTLAMAFAIGAFVLPGHAQAQSTTADLEQQIQALQQELDDLKAAEAATQQQAVQAGDNVNALSKAGTVVTYDTKKGMKLGPLTLKLGGFLAAEGVLRDKNEESDVGQSYKTSVVPFRNSPNDHQSELRGTGRSTRISLGISAKPDAVTSVTGYVEADFKGAAQTANSNQSNGYTPALRQAFVGYERSDLGLHIFAGQTWTLATLYKKGLLPNSENAPVGIDSSYLPGFTYLRNPELRIVKDFDKTYWVGLALDSPQTILGSSGTTPGSVENASNAAGQNFNSANTYTNNVAPDVTLKVAADTGFGHYELYGLTRFFEDRTTFPAAPAGQHQNTVAVGGGVGFGAEIPVIPDLLDFEARGLWGFGTGRFGATQLPDVTYEPDGSLKPIENIQLMAGLIGHVTPLIDVYGYAGVEQDHSTETGETSHTVGSGYGNALGGSTTFAGCGVEGGACTINFHRIEGATVGDWWKIYKGPAGTIQWGLQLSATRFDTFRGSAVGSGAPHAIENQAYVSFRYYPFQ